MPVVRSVLPVSTLCVEKITQLLVEVVSTGNHPVKRAIKCRQNLDIRNLKNIKGKLTSSTQKKIGSNVHNPEDIVAGTNDGGTSKDGVQDSRKTENNKPQEKIEAETTTEALLNDGGTSKDGVQDSGKTENNKPQEKTEVETTSEALPDGASAVQQDKSPECQDTKNQKPESPSPQQDASAVLLNQNTYLETLEEAHQQETITNSIDQDTSNGHQETVKSSNPDAPNIDQDKSHASHQETVTSSNHGTSESPQEDSKSVLQDSNENSPQKEAITEVLEQITPTELPPQAPVPDQPKQVVPALTEKQNRMASVIHELGELLESLSHAALHARLFTTVVAGLDAIYKRDKASHGPIQDIVAQFINFALLELDFGSAKMFSETGMCKVLFDHLDNATRLETLIIGRSCYWRSQIFERLHDKLAKLSNLTVLKIQFICTPEMLENLSEKCPKLCGLSVKGSEKITDKDCEEIAKCTGLKSLDISGTRITGRGCWKILDAVKELSWLFHCAFNCNSDSLLFESRADLFDYVKEQLRRGQVERLPFDQPALPREATFSLQNFWLFNPFSSDILTTTLCPRLSHLRLDFIFQDLQEEPDVEVLASLEQLTKLEVNFYDRCSVDLASQMITGCGARLTSLLLHLADDWFYAAQVHNVVASCCPNLINLTFTGDHKIRHSLEDCDDKLDFKLPAPAHPKLQHLKLVGVVSNQRLRFMLLHCPALVTLHLDGELEWLHDATFRESLQLNPLPYLQELWFNVSTTVTLSTVALILRQDNCLTSIGRLCHMAGSSMEQYQLFRKHIIRHNLDVKLIWVTDERVATS